MGDSADSRPERQCHNGQYTTLSTVVKCAAIYFFRGLSLAQPDTYAYQRETRPRILRMGRADGHERTRNDTKVSPDPDNRTPKPGPPRTHGEHRGSTEKAETAELGVAPANLFAGGGQGPCRPRPRVLSAGIRAIRGQVPLLCWLSLAPSACSELVKKSENRLDLRYIV